jgi:hypothetical protein
MKLAIFTLYRAGECIDDITPALHLTLMTHACSLLTGWLWCVWLGMATFAAFLLGVGTKLVVIHATDGQYIEAYAW